MQQVETNAVKLAAEHFQITKLDIKYFLFHEGEIYLIAFGSGQKTDENPKGKYSFWIWSDKLQVPHGFLLRTELKTKYDSIDYFETLKDNAEKTITQVLKEAA